MSLRLSILILTHIKNRVTKLVVENSIIMLLFDKIKNILNFETSGKAKPNNNKVEIIFFKLSNAFSLQKNYILIESATVEN